MNPRLVAIAGPRQGNQYELTDAELLIGREPSCWLYTADPATSRRHCRISKDAGLFKIADLDSRNGTFVNQIPVREKTLHEGDFIEIGNSIFLFLLKEQPVSAADPTVFNNENAIPTTELSFKDAIYLQPAKIQTDSRHAERTAQGLKVLLELSTTIQSIRNTEKRDNQLLRSILKAVPAERATILMRARGSDEPVIQRYLDKSSAPERPRSINRGMVSRVMKESIGIISNATGDLNVSSLLAVPLMVFERVVGVLYLETWDPRVTFDEEHLQFMTGVGAIASVALENTHQITWLESENLRLREDTRVESRLIGESAAMRDVHQFIARVAPADSTVLIYGESGTGKELAARAIHRNSSRSNKTFVAIDCAALAEPLLESELFGHEKGAFTGAIYQKKGKLEVADGGTVFLDEVAELSPVLQTKLLRVLQEREFQRVGGTQPIQVDVRLIAATNKNLEEAIKSGSFRQDLYYRLNVVTLLMPPLRTHREDIPLLAMFFASKYARKSKRRVAGISAEARDLLINHDWPGNVRELENAIERAVVLGTVEVILPEDLPEAVLEAQNRIDLKYYAAVIEAKRQIILKALEQAGGNHAEAAKQLGVHPNNLYRLMRNLNLRSKHYQS